MLTDTDLIPHRHFGMPGGIQKHTLVYTVVMAGLLAAFFELSRIASLGAIFYLVMDIIIHWGVLRHLRDDVGAHPAILIIAIALDLAALIAFVWIKGSADLTIVVVAVVGIVAVFVFERFFLQRQRAGADQDACSESHHG